MRFTEQNKKRTNPRYFLNEGLSEEVNPRSLETVKPGETIERGVVKGCKGALEVQKLLVQAYPTYKEFLSKKNQVDPLRIRKKLTDGIIGLYFAAAINSFIRASLGIELNPQRNDINYGYEYNIRGYRAICRDMENIKNLVLTMLPQQSPSGTTPEKAGAQPEAPSSQFPPSVATTTGMMPSAKYAPKEGDEMKGELGPEIYHNGEWIPKSEYEQLKKGLEEAKKRDLSYNHLKEQKNKKLFSLLIKG